MRKETYLQELEQLLYDIPAQDREEALQFYIDYLEDAGPEAEEEVLRSLGTPKELSESIRQALYGDHAEGDYCRVHKEVPGVYRVTFSTGGRFSGAEHLEEKKSRRRPKAGKWILLVLLIFCALPVIVPVCAAILGVIIAAICTLVAIVIALGVGGVGLLIAAIVVVVVAIIKLLVSPLSALIMLGGGLLMIGIGLLGIAVTAWIASKVIPAVYKGMIGGLSKIFSRR